jgi:hypothetical protein
MSVYHHVRTDSIMVWVLLLGFLQLSASVSIMKRRTPIPTLATILTVNDWNSYTINPTSVNPALPTPDTYITTRKSPQSNTKQNDILELLVSSMEIYDPVPDIPVPVIQRDPSEQEEWGENHISD